METWQNAMIHAMRNRNPTVHFARTKAYICNRYIHQAIAFERLGDNDKATMCLKRGLRVLALQNIKELTEQLKKVGNQTRCFNGEYYSIAGTSR